MLVIFLFALWPVLGAVFLRRARLSRRLFWLCFGALTAALVVRVLSMDYVSNDYAVFLSRWVRFFRENGGFAGIRSSVGDYNVPYLYFLAAISYLPVSDLYLIKLFSVFFDLLLAFSAMRLARQLCPGREEPPAAAFCAVLLLPTVVLNGAYWGQCDSVYAALTLLALADALDKKGVRSAVWLGLAFSFKLQAIFLVPLWCVLWYSGRVRFKDLLAFPAACLAAAAPAVLLGKPIGDILGVYFMQMGQYHDRLTLNAPSVYAILAKLVPLTWPGWEKAGILAAFALVALLLGGLWFARKRLTEEQLLAAGLVLAIGVPFLLPYMHERYFFLADVLSVVWCASSVRRVPVAAAVQLGSMAGYLAYLLRHFVLPLPVGAGLMALSLAAAGGWLAMSLVPSRRSAKGRL